MRVKQLWAYVPLPQSIKLVWDRLTFSRLTTIYFVIAIVHCFIQIILQISALYINRDASHVLAQIAAVDPNTPSGYAVLFKNGPLRACTGMPGSTGSSACQMVWAGRVAPDAFGGGEYDDYEYDEEPTTTSTSPVARTSTVFAFATAIASTDSNVAAQTTSRSTSSSLTSNSPSSTRIATTVTVSAIVTPSAPAPARKRMYIPAHVPGRNTHTISKRDLSLTPVFSQSNGTFQGVRLNGLSAANYAGSSQISDEESEAFVSSVCVHALQWPMQRLWNTQREDAVFIGFQVWVLGMSVVALLNESVPHIIAAFLTHVLATGWSAFQLAHTANFRSEFNRLTTRGACGGVNLLPMYWKARANAEITVLVLNAVVLIASGYMSWKLLKTFGWLTFKRVGASLEINRMYRTVLCLAIVLQLSLFFMVVSMALWIEELYNGPAASSTTLAPLYKAVVAIQLVALVPWLITGWYAVRREMRKTMIGFIVLSVLFIVAWAGMFVSSTWRLTFLTWTFFRIMSVFAAVLTVLVLGLGIVCLLNFGKDLPKHLRAIEDLEGADFVPAQGLISEKSEKVEFPAQNAYPTYEVAFPSRASSMLSGGARPGPAHARSGSSYSHARTASNHSHARSESTHSHTGSVTPPQVVARLPPIKDFEVERPVSTVRDPFEQDLARVRSNDTYPTMRSVSSTQSVSTASGPVNAAGMGKRWFIE